jgi:hypothetical protein
MFTPNEKKRRCQHSTLRAANATTPIGVVRGGGAELVTAKQAEIGIADT